MATLRILNRHFNVLFCILLAFSVLNVRTQESAVEEESGDEVVETAATHTPQFLSSPETHDVKEGDSITLQCKVDKLNPYFLIWYKGQDIIVTDESKMSLNPRIEVIDAESIMINSITKDDVGEYKCQLSVQGTELYLLHHIRLTAKPKIHQSPEGHVEIKEGQPLKLSCKVTGEPTPKVMWKNEGEDLRADISGKITDGGHSLTFDKIKSTDQGQYECEAHNDAGHDRVVFRVKVLYKPKLKIEQTIIPSGDNVKIDITCIVKAEPRARVSWVRDGKVLAPHDGIKLKSSDHHHLSIHISHLQPYHFGVYTCEAANVLGQAEENTVLKETPSVVMIKSPHESTSETTYEIEFSTQSITPVIEFQLLVRKVEDDNLDNWNSVTIPSSQHNPGKHTQKYMINGLDKGNEYEVFMKARNANGWNEDSKHGFRFTTAGGTMTRHSKVASTTESVKELKSGLNSANGASSHYINQRSKIVALITVIVLVAFF